MTILHIMFCQQLYSENNINIAGIVSFKYERSEVSNDTNELRKWSFVITDTSVGTILINTPMSCIKDMLPSGYTLTKEELSFDGDDDQIINAIGIIYNEKKIMCIIPQTKVCDKIESIIVYDPRFKVSGTNIHTGVKINELFDYFHLENFYFNIADGLYLMFKEFSGVFRIDIKGYGDRFESIESLPDNCTVEWIIIKCQE